MNNPNKSENAISLVNVLCANSCPPLKPIENNKYNDINLAEDSGIVKSLFKRTAKIPNTKNSRVGLVRFESNKDKFIRIIF